MNTLAFFEAGDNKDARGMSSSSSESTTACKGGGSLSSSSESSTSCYESSKVFNEKSAMKQTKKECNTFAGL